ncbi:MAG: DUF4169 family protein [Pseudorhodobacter sp.]|nr:DUF4169 family protein [Pseudorhodobacter sp.]
MAQIVNLKAVRKARGRAARKVAADANAAAFGLTPAERALQTARAAKARRELDGHARADPDAT